ncbi:MAG: hypothetical protein ACXVCR_01350 [Bdellovibrio sp.]
MNFPAYNERSDFSLDIYESVKALYQSKNPEVLWKELQSDKKASVFLAVLRIYAEDNNLVEFEKAQELLEDFRILPAIFSDLKSLPVEKIAEGVREFVTYGEFYGNEASEHFFKNEIEDYIVSWGTDSLIFFRKALLETPFYSREAEIYGKICGWLFKVAQNPDLAKSVEEIFLEILKDWQWNHPAVNAFVIKYLSLMKSEKALPLISACLAEKLLDEKIIRPNHIKKNYGLLFSVGESASNSKSGSVPGYAGDQKYGKLLHQIAHLGIDEARLMAMSEILSPEHAKPSVLISRILEHEALTEDDEPYTFCNEAEGMRFFNQTLAFWNECLIYRKQILPLVKPAGLSTLAFFIQTEEFFEPLLNCLYAEPTLFTKPQKVFLRGYRNLKEEADDWMEEVFKARPAKGHQTDLNNVNLENRLMALWNEGYPSFL